MTTTFVASDVWTELRKAARRAREPAHVAVAYFAHRAASMLPLAEGSSLVVDASELSVKSGRTCPAELTKMARRGTHVFSAPSLHAKVYVFGDRAFVGSANVSRNSRDELVEALISTAERRAVASARRFVRSLCLEPLGPEELARLQRLYRPPKFEPGARPPSSRGRRITLPRMRIAQLVPGDAPPESEASYKVGRQAARKRMKQSRSHSLHEFRWHGSCPFKPGELVLQVTKLADGRRMVERPAKVVHVQSWSRQGPRRYWVFVETPRGRRIELARLARRLGRGARKRLTRGGPLTADFAQRLLVAWQGSSR